ncbi:MAG: hypothetical protein QG578_688 [Thermodesulfobacteriota bacterium]|nr:hypothetical protein [Thermodesulfobacteriota bacterium]
MKLHIFHPGGEIMKPDSNFTSEKKFKWKTIACVILIILFLPAFSSSIEDERFSPFIETYPNGSIDWDNGLIYGVGRGYLHLNKDSDAIALRAAHVIAAGNILKVAAGVRLDDRRTLETLGKDRVVIELKALVRYRVHKTELIKNEKQPYYKVTLIAPLTGVEGLTSMLITGLKTVPFDWMNLPKPSAESVIEDEEKPWLVLDARDLPKEGRVKPAVFPKILSETGEVVYEPGMTDESALIQRGMAKYVVSDEPKEGLISQKESVESILERAGFIITNGEAVAGEPEKRAKRKNYIVKDVRQAQGLMNTNLLISVADTQELKKEDVSSRILKNCRVIVIVSSPIGGIEGNIPRYLAKVSNDIR